MFLLVKLEGMKQGFISSGCASWSRTDDLKDSPVFSLVQRCNSHPGHPPPSAPRNNPSPKARKRNKKIICFLYFGLHPFGQPIKHPTLPLSRKSFSAKSYPVCKVWHQLLELAHPFTLLSSSLWGQLHLWFPSKKIGYESCIWRLLQLIIKKNPGFWWSVVHALIPGKV